MIAENGCDSFFWPQSIFQDVNHRTYFYMPSSLYAGSPPLPYPLLPPLCACVDSAWQLGEFLLPILSPGFLSGFVCISLSFFVIQVTLGSSYSFTLGAWKTSCSLSSGLRTVTDRCQPQSFKEISLNSPNRH